LRGDHLKRGIKTTWKVPYWYQFVRLDKASVGLIASQRINICEEERAQQILFSKEENWGQKVAGKTPSQTTLSLYNYFGGLLGITKGKGGRS